MRGAEGQRGGGPDGPEPLGLVARILPFSAVDGPGNRAVFFLQGCDFDCAYCHNPETRAPCPMGSPPRARLLSAMDALAEIERFRPFLRGITVSGGECTLQPAFLASLLEAARARGLPGLVDTNGGRPLAAFPRLLEAAEGFMLDVKAWDPAEHRALAGADNGPVLGNLRLLAGSGALFEVRTVLALRADATAGAQVPAAGSSWAFDLEETVRETAAVLRAARSRARYRLIRYRPSGVRPAKAAVLREPGEELVARLAALAREAGAAEVLVS